jgi:hypothetical protein
MPKEIVRQYRKIYENEFMEQTLLALPKGVIKTRAFNDDGIGFASAHIIVNYAGELHPKINAVNMLVKNAESEGCGYKGFNGYIEVNPDMQKRPKEQLKVKLAEEWLELMMGFRDPESVHKSIRGKIPLALLFNSLKQRGFWQDSLQEHEAIHSALRSLLVPKDCMESEAREVHGQSLDEIKKLVDIDPQNPETQQKVEYLVLCFSAKYSVNKDLVWDRLMAIMFDGGAE